MLQCCRERVYCSVVGKGYIVVLYEKDTVVSWEAMHFSVVGKGYIAAACGRNGVYCSIVLQGGVYCSVLGKGYTVVL